MRKTDVERRRFFCPRIAVIIHKKEEIHLCSVRE